MNMANKTSKMDYCQLVEYYLGPKWVIATLYINLLSNFGSIIVYLVFISNFMLSTLHYLGINEDSGYTNDNVLFFQMLVFMFFFEIPLCILDKIKPLYILSFIGTGLLMYVIVVIKK